MKRSVPVLLLLLLVAGVSPTPCSAAVRRFAIVVGANQGASDRVRLHYAVEDAERFARLVQQMGGVPAIDCLTLREPARQPLLDALSLVRGRVLDARERGDRTEVLFYFSGHADESGLMLGGERLAYRELRDALAGMPADVGIAVLDACASGAITRMKGGRQQPAFLRDEGVDVHGHAYLTSSSEREAAQESDKLQGSFFTHALLTGLRGGADVSGDGKVTLAEAYQFAFDETRTRTAATQGGAQHPAYDIRMAGTGDVVLTDLRETSASLVLGAELDGRLYVSDASRRVVAELSKPAGRTVELGLEPGSYELRYEQGASLMRTRFGLARDERRTVTQADMAPERRQRTRLRGAEPAVTVDPFRLVSRSRVEVSFGGSDLQVQTRESDGSTYASGGGLALTFSHWLGEPLALEVSLGGTALESYTQAGPSGEVSLTRGLFHALFGARYYLPLRGTLRPHAAVAVGPVFGFEVVDQPARTDVSRDATNLGLQLRAAVDVRVGRSFVLTPGGGALVRVGAGDQYFFSLGVGWTFGGPKSARE